MRKTGPRWLWSLALLALAAGCTEPVHYPPAPVQCVPSTGKVANVTKAINIGPVDKEEDFDALYAKASDLGVKWIRLDFNWRYIEPEQGRFDWGFSDGQVRRAAQRGIQVLALPASSPTWASGRSGQGAPPRKLEDWLRFVTALVGRYSPGGEFARAEGWPAGAGITHWEIWNEPNLSHYWSPEPDAVAYAELLHQTSRLIRQHNPAAVLLHAGLSPGEGKLGMASFLRDLYAAGTRDCFDVVNIHPYLFPKLPRDIFATYGQEISQVMREAGDGSKPIWLTEFGYKTGEEVTEAQQADYVVEAQQELAKGYAQALFWFNLRDFGSDTYGLLHSDFKEKPSYARFKALP